MCWRLFSALIFVLFWVLPLGAAQYADALGRKIIIPSHPERIISLAPSVTETLFGLGLNREIVGVTRCCDYPEAARRKPKIGDFLNVSVEKIVSFHPDLIIGVMDGMKADTLKRLEKAGLPIYLVNPISLEGIFKMVEEIGALTGKTASAKRLAQDLRKRVHAVSSLTKNAPKPRIFFQIGTDPMVTVGRNTLHHELITLAGGINIAAGAKISYPRFSMEEVVARRPDFIIISSMERKENYKEVKKKWMKWKMLPAVRNNRVYVIDSDLTDTPALRIVQGLETMAGWLHPELLRGAPR
jgi:iron complex transport system substrate-binding protein